MLRKRHTIIVLLIIVIFDNVNSASVINEKNFGDSTLREFKIRDGTVTGNSSIEGKLRIKFFDTPVVNDEEIFEKRKPVIDSKTELFSYNNISSSYGDDDEGHDTREKRSAKTETTGEDKNGDNMNNFDKDDFDLGDDDQDKYQITDQDNDQDSEQDSDHDSDQYNEQGSDQDTDNDNDHDSDQVNDQENNENDEGDENDETELQTHFRHRHGYDQRRRQRFGVRYNHRNRHRYPQRHPHQNIPGKSRLKLPTGIFGYIKNHEKLMRRFRCGSKSILMNLKPGDYEYGLMAKEMQATIQQHTSLRFSKYKIRKIEKVVNGCLMRKYRIRQQHILTEYNHLNELMLFHGTNKVKELLATGFDERYASIDGMFGAGMYFAEHSSKSNQYSFGNEGECDKHGDRHCKICERQMLICRVTLGNIYKVRHARNRIAHPPPRYHSLEGVASNTPRGLKYNEYIIYRGEQAYPEYVVTYKLES